MAFFRNFFFYSLLFVWTMAMPLCALPFFTIRGWLKKDPRHVAARRTCHLYGAGWHYVIAPWVSITREGFALENFPQPCIIVANHQSFFDIHCMANVPIGNITFTVRSWPFRIPLYGFFMRQAQYLNVETTDTEAIVQQIKRDAADGSAIVFFPEAHRNPTSKIGRFHAGAFAVAIATKLPIVPICINGTGTVLPPGTPWITPGHIHVRALSPVNPQDFAHEGENASRMLRKYVTRIMREEMETISLPRHKAIDHNHRI